MISYEDGRLMCVHVIPSSYCDLGSSRLCSIYALYLLSHVLPFWFLRPHSDDRGGSDPFFVSRHAVFLLTVFVKRLKGFRLDVRRRDPFSFVRAYVVQILLSPDSLRFLRKFEASGEGYATIYEWYSCVHCEFYTVDARCRRAFDTRRPLYRKLRAFQGSQPPNPSHSLLWFW